MDTKSLVVGFLIGWLLFPFLLGQILSLTGKKRTA
jgi:hypothetical protein